ncbi:MAG: signaling protein consisting of a modified GGDEF domain and a DHH domain protein, partial [Oscillospiraceae bacterium]|nr:signaling protein consisting of a modified GGDEF domain and a DHH domain protein [Oscillospiraceae bacterium]
MKKHIIILDVLLGTLVLLSAAMAGALVRINVAFSLSVLLIVLLLFVITFFIVNRMGNLVDGHFYGTGQKNGSSQYSLEHMAVPIVILSGKNMVWYNDAFQTEIMGGKEACLQPVSKIVPGLDLKTCSEASGQCIDIASGRYTVYGAVTGEESNQTIAYFINDTPLKLKASEYVASRPAVFYLVLDTYDELNKDLKSSDSAQILSSISRTLEQFIGKTTGFLLRTGSARYMAVIEERHMQEIVENRFAILDKVRQIGGEVTTTLSIGVGRGGETFKECEEMASSALDMALGRGGDQAAVKTKEGFAFYGGVSRSVEKRDKVKSRIIATALKDLIEASDSVIIMGHK